MPNRQVTFLINARADQFKSAMKSAERTFKSVGRSMERTGRKLSQTVTAPLTIMGGLAVTAAAKFENSFADIRKTVNATDQQFRQISDGMRELSRTIPTSVNELNRIGGVAGQLGIQAENIVKFTETIAKLGDTTDIVGEEAALSLSRFMNIMGTARGDIDRLGSTIVGLGNNFAAMESEIVEIGNSLAPLGNAIGLTEQQVLAFSTTIAASGGKAQAASTAFQRIGNSMKKAVISGGKSLNRFAEVAGMSAEQFRTAFQENAGQALKTFLEGLQRVQEQGGSYAMVLEEMGMGTQRLTREVGKVLGNLDDLNRALPMANQEWQRNTALTEEAQKRYNTLISQLKITWNRIYDLGITIGNTLVPHVKELNELVREGVTFFSNLSEQTRIMGLKFAAAAAAIGPVVWVLGKISSSIGGLIGILGAVSWPVLLGVGAFVGAAVAITNNWDAVVSYFTTGKGAKLWNTLKTAAKEVWGSLRELFSAAGSLVSEFSAKWGDDVTGVISLSVSIISEAVTKIIDSLSLIIHLIRGDWKSAWESFKDVATSNIKALDEQMFLSMGSMMQSATAMTNLLTGDFKTAFEQFKFGYGFSNKYSQFRKEQQKNADAVKNVADKMKAGYGVMRTQAQLLIDDVKRLQKFLSMDLSLPKKTLSFSTNISTAGISSGISGLKKTPLSGMKARIQKQGKELSRVTKVALAGSVEAFNEQQRKIQQQAKSFASTMEGVMENAITSFANSIGKLAAGATSLKDVAIGLIDILSSMMIKIGSLWVAFGTGWAAAMNPATLFASGGTSAIVAGASLIAAGAALKAIFSDAGSNSTSVNDALVRSDGSIVEFHPDDNILAMRDFSGLATAGGAGGSQMIHNVLQLDGKTIWENQKQVNYKKDR